MRLKLFSFLSVLLITVFSFRNSPDLRPARILHQLFDSIKNVKTLRIKISALERLDKKYFSANSEVKLKTTPRKLYFINRNKKLEILYDAELSKTHAFVKQHVFPYVTLSLDPTGNLMRKNQHYTVNELGYEFIGISIALTISKDKEGVNNFNYRGKVLKNGYTCYFLEYENKTYSYVDYKIGENETVGTIASKLGVNNYLIHFKNGLINNFGYLKKGSVIKVPTLYCKKAVLYIDEKLLLPVSLSLYDDVGLFESYDFSDIVVNKPFSENEFKKSYKEYGF